MLFVGISLLAPVLAYVLLSWYNQKAGALPYYGPGYIIRDRPPFYEVPGFTFLDQDSLVTTGKFVEDRVWVGHYFFTTCPSICPKMMNSLAGVDEAFRGNARVRFVSFTVDPDHDTPRVLKAYALSKGIDGHRWQLLTGDKKDLYRYARNALSIVATDGDGGPGDFIHSEKLVLIDRNRNIRGYYDGTEPREIKQLINDINRLLQEQFRNESKS